MHIFIHSIFLDYRTKMNEMTEWMNEWSKRIRFYYKASFFFVVVDNSVTKINISRVYSHIQFVMMMMVNACKKSDIDRSGWRCCCWSLSLFWIQYLCMYFGLLLLFKLIDRNNQCCSVVGIYMVRIFIFHFFPCWLKNE